jgi:hypothetical protein
LEVEYGTKYQHGSIANIICKFNSKYTIYVHCQKIYNLFLRALETGRKDSI